MEKRKFGGYRTMIKWSRFLSVLSLRAAPSLKILSLKTEWSFIRGWLSSVSREWIERVDFIPHVLAPVIPVLEFLIYTQLRKLSA